MRIIFLLITLFFIFSGSSFAQKNKKMEERYLFAKRYYVNGDIQQSLRTLKEIIAEDSTYTEPYLFLAQIYSEHEQIKLLTEILEKLVKACGKKFPDAYLRLGNCYFYIGEMQKAKNVLTTLLQQKAITNNQKLEAEDIIKRCDFSMELVKHPVPFNPQNMDDSVNSNCDEYYPYLSPDEKTLVITRKVPKYAGAKPTSENTQEDFYVCEWNGSSWSKAKPLPGSVNTKNNEGAQTISGDGLYMVLAACNRGDGLGECDLYFSKKIDGKWTSPTDMGYNVNTVNWESQPSITSDGQTIYFASLRPGGVGSVDIWVTTRNEYGKWKKPVPLDTTINTVYEEQSPFIHPDGRTLYFCSNGHLGVGGFDLFYSRKDDDGKWSKPKNLGYPINTVKDEIGLIVNTKGDKAFITSSREGGLGLQDIYQFDLYKEARPDAVTYVKGKVIDRDTKKTLKAEVELKDVETGKTILKLNTDENDGSFLVCITKGKDYGLFVSGEGYMFYSENINLTTPASSMEPVQKEIPLSKISKGQRIILNNIFFDTDSASLKPASQSELNKLLAFMNTNAGIKVEISGHTDNVGKPAYNLDLSMRRAKAVYSYLITKGIPAARLSYKGYGETQPVATNDNEEGRAKNRRTEMKVVE